jgi:hypothetical protein
LKDGVYECLRGGDAIRVLLPAAQLTQL